jgi:hypothetical protein
VVEGLRRRPWIVIVEPDADGLVLVVVTVHEVSERPSAPCT